MSRDLDQDYVELKRVLEEAYNQAASGKGKERHACDKPFVNQPILEIARMVGDGYLLGQAMKKTQESQRLPTTQAKVKELLGAINYLAAAVIYHQEKDYHEREIADNNPTTEMSESPSMVNLNKPVIDLIPKEECKPQKQSKYKELLNETLEVGPIVAYHNLTKEC